MHVAPLAAALAHDLEAIGAKRTCRDEMDARLERTIGENPTTWDASMMEREDTSHAQQDHRAGNRLALFQ